MSTLDTVRFKICGSWKSRILGHKDSVRLFKDHEIDGTESSSASRLVEHPQCALRIGGSEEGASWCEVSLPRMFYGHNGVLMKPWDLSAALYTLQFHLDNVLDGAQLLELSRADLALHLPVRCTDAIAALRGTRHPAIRSMPREFFGTGLEWIGAEVVIRLYDKGVEVDGVTRDLMRLEFQLRSKALKKRAPLFLDGRFIDENLRDVYRDLVRGFQPRPIAKPANLVQFLALLVKEKLFASDGRSIFDVYLDMKKSERQRRRLRKAVGSVAPASFVLDLMAFVPVDAWPRFIDYDSDAEFEVA